MAKNRTKRVDSKQSTGPRRQRELLDSSKCKHDRLAVRTVLLDGGKYEHECWECILTARKTINPAEVTGATLLDLLLPR